MRVARLSAEDVALVGRIDRSERVEHVYTVDNGQLRERPVTMADVPAWDPTGSGPHSVAAHVDFCASIIAGGGILLGCFEDGDLLGVAVVDPSFEADMAWLAFLHVSRPHRRRGVGCLLWDAAVAIARDAGAPSMYVSATPTGAAVGFYLSRGCVLADPVHPALFADEPEDIHLVCALLNRRGQRRRRTRRH